MNVWIDNTTLHNCEREASSKYPLETGGIFMGRQADADNIEVFGMIGPGPKAVHRRHSFCADQEWQLERISAIYEAHNRRIEYLGDWHTHPGSASGTLSRIDRKTLRKIADFPKARCASPVMAIVFGSSQEWGIQFWRGTYRPRMFLMGNRFEIYKARIRFRTKNNP